MHTTKQDKIRITVTLDGDIEIKLKEIADCQRTSISSLVNTLLAEKLGLLRKWIGGKP
jgi:hypothetical protein